MDPIDPRDFGRLEAAVESMGREIGELKTAMQGMQTALQGMQKAMSEARGGGKVVQWLMGGGAGAVVAWLASHFSGGPKP